MSSADRPCADTDPSAVRRSRPTPRVAVGPRAAQRPPGGGHLRLAQRTANLEERTALALSILRHRAWHPDDAPHVQAVVAALLGASIEELLAAAPVLTAPGDRRYDGRPPS